MAWAKQENKTNQTISLSKAEVRMVQKMRKRRREDRRDGRKGKKGGEGTWGRSVSSPTTKHC